MLVAHRIERFWEKDDFRTSLALPFPFSTLSLCHLLCLALEWHVCVMTDPLTTVMLSTHTQRFSQPWCCGHHHICSVFPDGQLEGWSAGWGSLPSRCLWSSGVDWEGGHTRESWPKADDVSPIKLALCFSALRNLTAKTALMKSCQSGYCLNSVCYLGLKSWL